MKFRRASGVLLHPTSLPGEFGIGDLGPQAYAFVNFLEEARQRYWQILPLGPTGYGDSPYSCFSAFAGNTLLISPEALVSDGFLTEDEVADRPNFGSDRVDYGGVYEWKNRLLPAAYATSQTEDRQDLQLEFEAFVRENDWWLNDYAAYRSIKAAQGQRPWYEWPEPIKLRKRDALAAAESKLAEQIRKEKFYQFLFFRQWSALKEYANKHGIEIIGDIPIFVALDSADVWCNQEKFKLNPDGSPEVVSGVPPDYFSKTGQLWGNPIYDWDAMKADGFSWWIARIAHALRVHDIVRIDHFVGFAAAWEVPGGDATAENGNWVRAPGDELFTAATTALGELPLIVEDLGVITAEVEELRDRFRLPGMKILQFAFGGDAGNGYLPHNYVQNCVAYTGTHDNDTAVGWWRSLPRASKKGKDPERDHERRFAMKYLDTNGREIHWDMIRAVWASVADTAICQVQDLVGIGSDGRMNLPASTDGNWYWRLTPDALTPEIAGRLRSLTELFGRTK